MLSNRNYLSSPYFYLLIWLIINLIQGGCTLLGDDEAYYWQCSQAMSAGYFHQPPGIKWFIYLGYSIFQNEFGVRMVVVLISTLTHFFLFKIVEPKNIKLYFLLVFSSILVHFGGFYVAPDVAMLFFSSAFLLVLKYYIKKDSWGLALLLAILAAGVAYSKYHGAMVVIPALLINWRLFKRLSFWIIPAVGVLLFVPHILWQIEHNFITFNFHLIERSPEGGRWYYPLHFIGSILIVHGPLLSVFLFTGAFKEKAQDQFETTLKWVMYGVLAFFLYMSFQTRVEANWTAAILFPVMYFGYRYINARPNLVKWSYRLVAVSWVLIIVFRVWLVFDFATSKLNIRKEFHNTETWAKEVAAIAGGRPVVFVNSYQKASKYNFYSGSFGHSISSNNHGGDEFNIMYEAEEYLQGKEVVFVTDFLPGCTKVELSNGLKLNYQLIKNFRSYNRIELEWINSDIEMKGNQDYELEYRIINRSNDDVSFVENDLLNPAIFIETFYKKEPVSSTSVLSKFPWAEIKAKDTLYTTFQYQTPADPKQYRVRASIKPGFLFPERNGVVTLIDVE